MHPDTSSISSLSSSLSSLESSASPSSLSTASLFHLLQGSTYDATRYAGKALPDGAPLNPQAAFSVCAHGWAHAISLNKLPRSQQSSSDRAALEEAIELCQQPALQRDVDALMLKAYHFSRQGRHQMALDELNSAIAIRPGFGPALFEKCKVFLSMGSWDQASEMCQRLCDLEDFDLDSPAPQPYLSSVLSAFLNVTSVGRDLGPHMSALEKSAKASEPGNAALHLSLAALFSRVSGRSSPVLSSCLNLASKASKAQPTSESLSLLASIYRLQGEYGRALDVYV
jgi:tetratricopeptide (TPR) repeat protein